MSETADVVVVGSGLAGLVAASELADAGRTVLLLDQEGVQSLGGQAFWSLGGLFLIDSPEQRRMGIRDSHALALSDWMGTAGFDRDEDRWPRLWAEAYVDFAAGEMRSWLKQQGLSFFPVVGWAERGGHGAYGHGNSVPRFHVTWGTGPGVVAPFARRVKEATETGRILFRFRHRVDEIVLEAGQIAGVRGTCLAPDDAPRGAPSTRDPAGPFEFSVPVDILASGGIGGDFARVRRFWPDRLGKPPRRLLCGVPDYVNGRLLDAAEAGGARVINRDRMWHYVEGVHHWDPIWPHHGIRILPGPSSLWFDALGRRLPMPLLPGFDTLGTLQHIVGTGYDYSWLVLTQSVIRKEFALSGSEQNPDLTGKSWRQVLVRARGRRATGPVEAFKVRGADLVVRDTLAELVDGMKALAGDRLIDPTAIEREINARDRQLDNPFTKDPQIMAIRNARAYRGDRFIRTAAPHRFLDPRHGPLIAVRLSILTRKSLRGLATDLSARVFGQDGAVIPGLYAPAKSQALGAAGCMDTAPSRAHFSAAVSTRVVSRVAPRQRLSARPLVNASPDPSARRCAA